MFSAAGSAKSYGASLKRQYGKALKRVDQMNSNCPTVGLQMNLDGISDYIVNSCHFTVIKILC